MVIGQARVSMEAKAAAQLSRGSDAERHHEATKKAHYVYGGRSNSRVQRSNTGNKAINRGRSIAMRIWNMKGKCRETRAIEDAVRSEAQEFRFARRIAVFVYQYSQTNT